MIHIVNLLDHQWNSIQMFQVDRLLSFELRYILADMLGEVRPKVMVQTMGRNCDRGMRNLQETSLFIIICSLLWFKYPNDRWKITQYISDVIMIIRKSLCRCIYLRFLGELFLFTYFMSLSLTYLLLLKLVLYYSYLFHMNTSFCYAQPSIGNHCYS